MGHGRREVKDTVLTPDLKRRVADVPCWPALCRCFGDVRPAATMIVAGLADARMKFEIEVTARRAA